MIAMTIVSICLLLLVISTFMGKKLKLPPSPPRLPLLGNLHLMKGAPFRLFSKLSETYGPIFTLWLGPRPVIVINEETVARQALTLRAKQISGRPHRYTGSLYSRNFKGIVLSDDDDGLKYRRRLAHQTLRSFGENGDKLEKLIRTECKDLVRRLKTKSKVGEAIDIRDEISVAVLNVICALVFGSRYEVDDPEFKQILEANEWFIEGIQSSPLIDGFPLLRFLPFRQVRLIKDFVKVRDRVLEQKLRDHEETFDETNIRDFTDALIYASRQEELESSGKEQLLTHDHKVIVMGDLFLAGGETTATSLNWAILYMVHWKDIQRHIQSEIDSVYEADEDPKLADKSKLSYLEATAYDIMRLSSVAPLGVPHKATEDTSVAGYDIPKGTVILFNYYAMHHNDKVWKNPYHLVPERHISEDGKFIHPTKGFLPFSMGRRACLGETLAKMEFFLFFTYLMKEFEFEKDPKLKTDLTLEGKIGATWAPQPYKVLIKPRSSNTTGRTK